MDDETGPATERFQQVVADAGFVVQRAFSAGEARSVLASDGAQCLDLVVLDRKLPEAEGDQALEAVGDDLFRETSETLRDAAIVVLTGYSDEDSLRLALQRPNALDVGSAEPIAQIQHFRKSAALDFRTAVTRLAQALSRTEEIELEASGADATQRRILKRVGQKLGGDVVRARAASGGLTDASVWICDVSAGDGRPLTSVVVKIAPLDTPRPTGGFMTTIPSRFAAIPLHYVRGACRGLGGQVAVLAGQGATPLMETLKAETPAAISSLAAVLAVLEAVPSVSSLPTLSEFIAPLIGWERAMEIACTHGVELPDRSLPVSAHVGCIHGDLHPGNVLVDGGRPVFIDFDSQTQGALMVDVLTLALGAVFHRDGPLRDDPPTVATVEALLQGAEMVGDGWLEKCAASWASRSFGDREKWSALLGYGIRQLKYDDVRSDERLVTLAVALARLASKRLRES